MPRLPRRTRRLALAALAASAGLIAPAGADAAPATYTHTQTIPVPPASNYSGTGGGDGWAIALSSSSVYNVFHHDPTMTVACHRQSDASECWSPKTVMDGDGHTFGINGQPGMQLDQATGKLYVFAARSSDDTGGVVCFDTVAADAGTDPFCGFTPLTPAGGTPNGAGVPALSNPSVVRGRMYAMNFVTTTGDGGAANRMLCLDLATHAPCAGQPFAAGLSGAVVSASNFPAPATAEIGGRIVWLMSADGKSSLRCFDTATDAACAGSWPQEVTGVSPSTVGAPVPLLSPAGAATGFCLPAGTSAPCFALDGTPASAPPGFTDALPSSTGWNGPAVTIGPRVYIPSGTNDSITCWDFLAGKACANFPKALVGAGYMYTVNRDPARPDCLWVNADYGSAQIQNFDAFSGGACGTGAIRVVSSAFIAPQPQCSPTAYLALRLLDPARSAYASGSVTIADASGTPLPGAAALSIDGDGSVDLQSVPIDPAVGLPQFIITLSGAPAQQSAVTVEITWRADFDATCSSEGTQAAPDPVPTATPAAPLADRVPAPAPAAATPVPTPAPQGAVLAARAEPRLIGRARFRSHSLRVGHSTTLSVRVSNTGNAASTSGKVCVRLSSTLVVLRVPKGVTTKGSVLCARRGAIDPDASATAASGIVVRAVRTTAKATARDGASDGVALTGDRLRVLRAPSRAGGVTG